MSDFLDTETTDKQDISGALAWMRENAPEALRGADDATLIENMQGAWTTHVSEELLSSLQKRVGG